MAAEVVVIDYHKGNLSSVERSLADCGARVTISDDADAIAKAPAVVLPGVGSFFDAISFMRETGQDEAVLDAVGAGAAFLGICLGQHLIFERGDEGADGWVAGLGLCRGSIARLESDTLKVPHVGWNQLSIGEQGRACALLDGVADGAHVYFTHSYATAPDIDPAIVAATTSYTREFASCTWSENVYAVQFHPEKSSATGMRILKNFVDIARGAK